MPKAKAPISFTIKRSKKTKQFRCVVANEGNHEPTLVGEPCHNQADVRTMIAEHIAAVKEDRYLIIPYAAPVKPVKKKRASRVTTKVTS